MIQSTEFKTTRKPGHTIKQRENTPLQFLLFSSVLTCLDKIKFQNELQISFEGYFVTNIRGKQRVEKLIKKRYNLLYLSSLTLHLSVNFESLLRLQWHRVFEIFNF